jgi:hypothetical protein
MRIAALVLVAVLPAFVAAQSPRDVAAPAPSVIGQGIIAGTVVADDADGRPVRRAVVTASAAGLNGDRKTVTDDNGHFAVTGLPAGRYTLSATKAGWLTAYYGSKHPGRPMFGGSPIVLQDGQRLTTVALRLLHGSAITGVITDAFGRPTPMVQVQLVAVHVENGQRSVDPMGGQNVGLNGPGSFVPTDDRGIYRLYGIPPGNYLIVASSFETRTGQDVFQLTPDDLQAARRAVQPGQSTGPTPTAVGPGSSGGSAATAQAGQTVGYALVYYPGTLEASNAVVVTLGANEERSGVDFALTLAHTARVQGVVLEPDGRPAPGGQIQLQTSEAETQLFFQGNQFTRVTPDGKFTFSGVAPGHYTLVARAPDTAAAPPTNNAAGSAGGLGGVIVMRAAGGPLTLWATETAAVDGQDLSGLTLRLQRGATIAGRLAWNGTTLKPPTNPMQVGVRLTPVTEDSNSFMGMGMGGAMAQVDATGGLKFTNVAPGRYRIDISMNSGRGMVSPAAATALKGWSPRSAVVGDRDALDLPFEVAVGAPVPDLLVTLTDRLAEISGTVTDPAGHPISAYRLVVFSADKALWGTTGRRLKAPVPTDPDGTFRIGDLPPGEYFLAAVTDMEANDLKDASFLAELAAQAIRLTLGEGEKKVQNIKVPGG